MSQARVIFDGQEIELGDRIVTCGRAPDNSVAFTDDGNVSRYHAEIEPRTDGFWLIDLGSSNGTTVNGRQVIGEIPLSDGDVIVLGGSSEFRFSVGAEAKKPEPAPAASAATPIPAAVEQPIAGDADAAVAAVPSGGIATEAAAVSEGSKNLLLVAAVVCGVAILCVAGGMAAYFVGRVSSCDAKAVITKPEAGDTIANPVEVEVEAENTGCVSRAIFTIDGLEIASIEEEPYTISIDPNDYGDLADGLDHGLAIVLFDEDGQQIGQPSPVLLAFESRAVGKPSPTPEIVKGGDTQQQQQQQSTSGKSSAATLLDVQQMSLNLLKQFRGNFTYNIANRQFMQEVQRRAAEYAVEGYFDRAAVYRDAINVAYVREQNLDAPLGFILAMSRSKFVPTKQGDNEGLWQMSNGFVTANAYNGLCGTETLSDASQNCAAKASALYMKAIVYGVFDGDPVYSAAVFGKSPQEASAWKASLPANRSDLWNVIKTPQERDQLVRFFAAGIVAENPQKFGLKKDRPLSELYRVTM